MKKLSSLGQTLSKDEMKNVVGGGTSSCYGSCNCDGSCNTYFHNIPGDSLASYCSSACSAQGKRWAGICSGYTCQ